MINNEKKEKNRRDIGRIATKIVAGILVIAMVIAFAGTLIFYLTA